MNDARRFIRRYNGVVDTAIGKDVSDETIADAKAPLIIQWLGDSFVPMPFSDWKLATQKQVFGSKQLQALVYIHGFKKNFEDAAYRTAQLGVDLRMSDAALFMFSWPSKNSVTGYASDEETVRLAVADLNRFLTAVLDSTGARRVSIIAHSMGSRLLASVLQEFKAHPPAHMPTEVVFAAPDINAEEFRRVIEPNIRGTSGRLTVYTSEHDQALRVSKKAHAHPRLGEGGPAVFGLTGFDKIDVTNVDLDLLGHGYYAQTQKVVEDIRKLLVSGLGPVARKLVPDRPVSKDVAHENTIGAGGVALSRGGSKASDANSEDCAANPRSITSTHHAEGTWKTRCTNDLRIVDRSKVIKRLRVLATFRSRCSLIWQHI